MRRRNGKGFQGRGKNSEPFLEGAGETLYKKPAADRIAKPGNGFFPGPVPWFFREEDAYAEKTFSADLSGNGSPSGRAPALMGGHGRFLQGWLDQQRSPELWNQQLRRVYGVQNDINVAISGSYVLCSAPSAPNEVPMAGISCAARSCAPATACR